MDIRKLFYENPTTGKNWYVAPLELLAYFALVYSTNISPRWSSLNLVPRLTGGVGSMIFPNIVDV